MWLVMSELGSLRMHKFELLSVMLHGISDWSGRSGDRYWTCWAEVLVFLRCGEHRACRTPW